MIASYDTTPFYWLFAALSGLPSALWMYVGVGVPWALALAPRRDWRDWPFILCLAFAFGPAWVTAWMLALGSIGAAHHIAALRWDWVLMGTVVISGMGLGIATYRWRSSAPPSPPSSIPWRADEKLLVGLIIIALILRWFTTAYWPFTAYDELWVYGYEGRLYFLKGFIPQDIGYYPQFLPLQYTYVQLAIGALDDHAARVVLPFLHLGSILAAYVLGARLVNRRTGIILASLWALYPHLSDWAHVGDLEVPLTFLFTTSTALFLIAWLATDTRDKRHYALLSGCVFGVAMWTKPTAGAFVWGVILTTAVAILLGRLRWRAWWPQFEVAALTGLACLPLGAVWYIRNIALGHAPIDLPHESWLLLARRSGDLLGWIALAWGLWGLTTTGPGRWARIAGVLLLLAGILPSSPLLFPQRLDPPDSYIRPLEALLILGGLMALIWGIRNGKQPEQGLLRVIFWSALLAMPYFITYFFSYSYHYRLSFAIVPLLALPSAIALARWDVLKSCSDSASWRRFAYLLAIAALSIQGILDTIQDINGYSGWLLGDDYPHDVARYTTQNPEVVITAQALDAYITKTGVQPVVIAPGEQRLRFFLPLATIVEKTQPSRLNELEGATHFVYGALARWRYENFGLPLADNQIVNALARKDIMEQVARHADGTFRYELYELHLDKRFIAPQDSHILHLIEDAVCWAEAICYLGDNVSTLNFIAREPVDVDLLWRAQSAIDVDAFIRIQLFNADDAQVYAEWDFYPAQGLHGYYSTRLWEAGELVSTPFRLQLPDPASVPNGRNYRLRVQLISAQTGIPLALRINHQQAEAMPLVATFKVITE